MIGIMIKIVINRCYGGFQLSIAAQQLLGITTPYPRDDIIKRDDPKLIAVVEQLGENAQEGFSHLKIVEIPDGSFWKIEEYDGMEHVEYSASEIRDID